AVALTRNTTRRTFASTLALIAMAACALLPASAQSLAAPALAPCSAKHLTAAAGPTTGATGHVLVELASVNHGAKCSLRGYPSVTLLDANGKTLRPPESHSHYGALGIAVRT